MLGALITEFFGILELGEFADFDYIMPRLYSAGVDANWQSTIYGYSPGYGFTDKPNLSTGLVNHYTLYDYAKKYSKPAPYHRYIYINDKDWRGTWYYVAPNDFVYYKVSKDIKTCEINKQLVLTAEVPI